MHSLSGSVTVKGKATSSAASSPIASKSSVTKTPTKPIRIDDSGEDSDYMTESDDEDGEQVVLRAA